MAPQSPRVPGDIELARTRAAAAGQPSYASTRASYMKSLDAAMQRRAAKAQQEEQARRAAAAGRQSRQSERDQAEQQQQYAAALAAQRANIAADQAAADARYRQQFAQQQQQADRKTQESESRARRQQQLLDIQAQTDRDRRQFGAEAEQQQRQNLYQFYRDMLQHQNTLDRDVAQYGLNAMQSQQDLHGRMQQEYLQGQIQADRDLRLYQYDVQQRQMQDEALRQRDAIAFQQATMQREAEQKFARQSQFEREAADIAARWQAGVQERKDAGLDFSPQQQQQMQKMEEAFYANVVSSNLPDDVKARAAVRYQQQLSAIMPSQKVITPEQEINDQFYLHPQLGMMQRRVGSNGLPEWNPIGMGGEGAGSAGDSQAAQLQFAAAQKAQLAQEKAMNDARKQRIDEFEKVYDSLATATTPAGDAMYDTATPDGQQKLLDAAKRRFEARERVYTENIGLEPFDVSPYQPTNAPPAQSQPRVFESNYGDRANAIRSGANTQTPATTPPSTGATKPANSKLNSQFQLAAENADSDAIEALGRVAELTAKGPPRLGSQEMQELTVLLEVLAAGGYDLTPPPPPPPVQSRRTPHYRFDVAPGR